MRPVLDGLRIDLVLPPRGEEYVIHRVYRGCTSEIRVKPGSERTLTVDGQRVEDLVVRDKPGVTRRVVEVTLPV